MVNDARVFARVRKIPEPPGDVDVPSEGDGSDRPVPGGEVGEFSDWNDCVRDEMGMPSVFEGFSLP